MPAYNGHMKDMDWRRRFAPHGYAYVKQRIGFETLTCARFPSDVVEATFERMLTKLSKDYPHFYDPSLAQTRVSVYPKEIGENLNHLDPLRPRFGIEIEIRQPVPKDVQSQVKT